MTRIATTGLQQNVIDSIMSSQERLSTLQSQLSSGKKATTYRDLGTDAPKTISARSALDRIGAFQSSGKQLSNILNLYDIKFGQLSELASNLKSALSLHGEQSGAVLQETVQQSFMEFRSIMLSDDTGFPMFAAPRGEGAPFKIDALADAVKTDDEVFGTSTGRNSALVADGIVMPYGSDARTVGSDLMAAFRSLASQPNLESPLTDNQITAINQALDHVRQAQTAINIATAQNGDNLRRLSDLNAVAERRMTTLSEAILSYEDVNIAEVASQVTQQKSLLEASYAAFSRLSGLSLVNFLR